MINTEKVTTVCVVWVQLEEQSSCSSPDTMTIVYHIDLGYELQRREGGREGEKNRKAEVHTHYQIQCLGCCPHLTCCSYTFGDSR